MEPLSLQVQGIRPWKSDRPTTIAFLAGEPRTVSADDDPADQASIHQAIAYAVHGQTPCSDRHTLMNEDARRMSVSLIFWAHGGAWCVRRRARRLPDGAVVDAGCMLKRFGGETIQDGRRMLAGRTPIVVLTDSPLSARFGGGGSGTDFDHPDVRRLVVGGRRGPLGEHPRRLHLAGWRRFEQCGARSRGTETRCRRRRRRVS